MRLNLEGRCALITGSSAGIGLATASALIDEGVRVVLCGRDRTRLEFAAAGLASQLDTEPPFIVSADMASVDGPARAVAAAVESMGRLDILVNNASNATTGSILSMSPDQVEQHLDSKPIGYVRACLAAVPAMRASGGGVIVNIAGISAHNVSPTGRTTLGTTGVIGLTKALSEEVAEDGIRVVAVSPGVILTPHMADNFAGFAESSGSTLDEVERGMVAQIPLRRFGRPEEVADAIVFLCSSRAAYITGTVLVVDGGKSRSIG
jgi:NAD(P)-dependent dehydrogenase (short-subunit alcohol dehydrogenase family)